ncbi:hypothetical protein [Streptomyces sp. JV190]|uniref:hypothetical protein n=1 Tax=Streptomyces sp. JV190 TaxID=3002533 RepID=UPI003FA77CB9
MTAPDQRRPTAGDRATRASTTSWSEPRRAWAARRCRSESVPGAVSRRSRATPVAGLLQGGHVAQQRREQAVAADSRPVRGSMALPGSPSHAARSGSAESPGPVSPRYTARWAVTVSARTSTVSRALSWAVTGTSAARTSMVE